MLLKVGMQGKIVQNRAFCLVRIHENTEHFDLEDSACQSKNKSNGMLLQGKAKLSEYLTTKKCASVKTGLLFGAELNIKTACMMHDTFL
jgi:hypothetical protein